MERFIERVIMKQESRVIISDYALDFMFLASQSENNVIKALMHLNAYNAKDAKTIQEISGYLGKDRTNTSRFLKQVYKSGVIHRFNDSERNYRYFIPKESFYMLKGKTVLPESVETQYTSQTIRDNNPVVDCDKSVKKDDVKKKIAADVITIFDYYMEKFNKDHRYKPTPDRKAVIANRLQEGFSVEECKQHIDFIANSPFHNGENNGGKLYIDLKDIIFNKNKFHKRLDEMKNTNPNKSTSATPEDELRRRYEERHGVKL